MYISEYNPSKQMTIITAGRVKEIALIRSRPSNFKQVYPTKMNKVIILGTFSYYNSIHN